MQITLLILLCITPVDTMEFTLDQAIDHALEYNPEIKQLSIEHAKSTTQVGQARSAFYPNITASGSYAYLTDIPVIEFDSIPIPFGQSENYSIQVSLQQVLFAWGQIYNAYKISDTGEKIAELTLERKKQETRFAVTDAFYSLLVLEEMVKLTRESMAQLKRHERAVETRYKAGLVSQFELLRAQVQVANLKPQMIAAENGFRLAQEGFKMLLGLDLDKEVFVKGELTMAEQEFNLDSLTDQAMQNRVEIKNLIHVKRISELSRNIARTSNLPMIVAGAIYERKKPFSITGDEWGSDMIFNIGVQWTLFSGFKNFYAYKQATLEMHGAQLAYDNLRKAIQLEVRQAYLNFLAAKQSLTTAQENVKQAETAYNIMETRYKAGVATNLEYLDAQLAGMQASTNYLSALKDYYSSRAAIFKAIGKEE